jgi:hypothetical protein
MRMIYQKMYFFYPFDSDETLDDVMYLEDTLDDKFFIEVSNINKTYFLDFKVQVQIFVFLILIIPFV